MRGSLALLTLIAAVLVGEPALAHHPMGGVTPFNFTTGLLSGIGDPLVGFDHFAFVVAMGFAAAFTARPLLSPLAFILATAAGTLIHVGGVTLPAAELVISGSVVVIGAMVLSGRGYGNLYPVLFGAAGVFHGWAYGEAILGAEATPLIAYLIGFVLVQYAVAAGIVWLTRNIWAALEPSALRPRLAGAVAAGIGAAFFVETVEGLVFAV